MQMSFEGMLILPLLGLLGLVYLIVKRKYKALAVAGSFFTVYLLTGAWAIFQSTNSTAAMSLLVLPSWGTICAFFAALFVRLRSQQKIWQRLIAWAACAGAIYFIGYNIWAGFDTRKKNSERLTQISRGERDSVRAAQMDIDRAVVSQSTRRPGDVVDDILAQHPGDHHYVLAVLTRVDLNPSTLEKLSHTDDIGVKGGVAGNNMTPVSVLEDIYQKDQRKQFAIAFARNPSAPKHILDDLAQSTNLQILRTLVFNRSLDCEQVKTTRQSIAKASLKDHDLASTAEAKEKVICAH
jgi:hypothetical protein